jgi:Domain of unknown function (DUF4262)
MCDIHGKCGSCGTGSSVSWGQIKLLDYTIRQNGFSIVYAFDNTPHYAYTVGLQKTWNHRELIVFGLNQEMSHDILTETAALIKGGASFESDQNTELMVRCVRVTFIEVPQHIVLCYLDRAEAYYEGHSFNALQILWADEKGRFPTDSECSEDVKRFQPVLTVAGR